MGLPLRESHFILLVIFSIVNVKILKNSALRLETFISALANFNPTECTAPYALSFSDRTKPHFSERQMECSLWNDCEMTGRIQINKYESCCNEDNFNVPL